jgi:cytosine/adenosine deaminase-related metal-dependent hydrolase
MFEKAQGEMFDWLKRSLRDMSDCGGRSPVQHLHACGLLGENLLAVHANYLKAQDAELLGKAGATVVHCPRSHSYFRHAPFPLSELQNAGVNVCLGTDSLASVYKTRRQKITLSMFEEMRTLWQKHSSLSPEQVLKMATVNGALALGLAGRIGELSKGSFADLIAIPCNGSVRNAHETVLSHTSPVLASMIDGKWAIAPLST